MEGRIICIDLGTKKTGIAISDPLQIISQPFKIIRHEANDQKLILEEILKISLEMSPIACVVIGYPISHKNFETIMSRKVLEFKELLYKNTNLKIFLQEERFSSKQADLIMTTSKFSKKKKKEHKDALAAQIILNEFLLKSDKFNS